MSGGRLLWLGGIAALVAGCPDPDKFKDDVADGGGAVDARAVTQDAAPPAGDAAPEPGDATPEPGDAAPGEDAAPGDDAAPPDDAAVGEDAAPPPRDAAPPPIDAAPVGPCQVRFVVQLPDDTPAGDDLYLAGNVWGWLPGSPTQRMARDGNVAEFTAPLEPGTQVEYKYTRGDWPQVERAADCSERDNRGAFVQCGDDRAQTIQDVVDRWLDVHCGG